LFAPLESLKVFAGRGGMDWSAEEEEQTVCEPLLHSARLPSDQRITTSNGQSRLR
jgi:hypothetical protein